MPPAGVISGILNDDPLLFLCDHMTCWTDMLSQNRQPSTGNGAGALPLGQAGRFGHDLSNFTRGSPNWQIHQCTWPISSLDHFFVHVGTFQKATIAFLPIRFAD